jgi:hypothetical protein
VLSQRLSLGVLSLASRTSLSFTPSIIETFRQLPSQAYLSTPYPSKHFFSTSRPRTLKTTKPSLPVKSPAKLSTITMATELKKEIIKEGNKTDKPQNGDTVTMEYTGWLFEDGKEKNRGKQ